MNLLYLLFIYINESQLTLKAKRSDNYDRRRKEGVGYYSKSLPKRRNIPFSN